MVRKEKIMRWLKCLLDIHEWVTILSSAGGRPIRQKCKHCPYRRDWGGIWFSGWQKPYKSNG